MSTAGGGQADHLIVARVRRPHGVRGEVQISVDTDRPRAVFRPGRTLGLGNPTGEPTGRTVVVETMRSVPNGALLRLQGVTSREAAALLRGNTLLIGSSEAAPAGDDEIHYRHLVGLAARLAGAPLGRVEGLLELPGGLTLVIRTAEGKEILVPFVREMVLGVDLEAGALDLELPEGLLDL